MTKYKRFNNKVLFKNVIYYLKYKYLLMAIIYALLKKKLKLLLHCFLSHYVFPFILFYLRYYLYNIFKL